MTDFTYLSLGAGLQSSTIAEMIVEGELPPVDLVLFADTKDEPDYVYKQVDYLRGRLARVGIELRTVNGGDIIANAHDPNKRFAAMPVFTQTIKNNEYKTGRMKRQCTTEFKIVPIEAEVKQELLKRGMAAQKKRGIYVNRGLKVECWLGITLDEVERMRPNKHKWIDNRWPLIDLRMYRMDCATWLMKRGLPVPLKSSCRVCPFHKNSYWSFLKDERSNDWKHVVDFDDFIRSGNGRLAATAKGDLFLHKDCVPLSMVDLSTE